MIQTFSFWYVEAMEHIIIPFTMYFCNLGIHNPPLDGSDIQTKTTKEQDPRKDKEVKISTYDFHASSIFCGLKKYCCGNGVFVLAEIKLDK